MIRFRCPHCDRAYLLPDALARLPLLCRGCGARLDVPDPGPDPAPDPLPDLQLESPPDPPQPPTPAPPAEEPFFTPAVKSAIDLRMDAAPEMRPEPKPKTPDPPPGAAQPATPASPADRKALGVAADVAMCVPLAAGGAFLGELATQKSTAEVFDGAAKQMPPVDLLVWAGCVVFPVLVYALLAGRGKSLGAWLRRAN